MDSIEQQIRPIAELPTYAMLLLRGSTVSRIKSVDVFRVLAILAVVVIHSAPFSEERTVGTDFNLATILNQLCRFAVPFFFVMSGYFWSAKIASCSDALAPTLKMARRILVIFLFWSVVYLGLDGLGLAVSHGLIAFAKGIVWHIATLARTPVTSVFQGSKSHLWFLPALLTSVLITAVFVARKWIRPLIFLAIVLYAIGLAGHAYIDSPAGFRTEFNFRNGPFFGLIFFVTGHLLYKAQPKPSWLWQGLCVASFGLIAQFSELYTIHQRWAISLLQDYVAGTYFVGLGVSMMALSNDSRLHLPRLAGIGPVVLGVYAVHFVFVDLFQRNHGWTGFSWLDDSLYVLAVFALSVVTALLMSRHRLTRPFVS
jgi:surface polysaccharide O-acyltransferase-like enzyme